MAFKLISQDITALQRAYQEREREYNILRSAKAWAGAVLHAGMLLELALKIAISKHLDADRLPRVFQVHDLEFLLYCSGLRKTFVSKPNLYSNFFVVVNDWSMELRYEGAIVTEQDADNFHHALYDATDGVLTFLLSL